MRLKCLCASQNTDDPPFTTTIVPRGRIDVQPNLPDANVDAEFWTFAGLDSLSSAKFESLIEV
jgi:hypothetical protein